MDSSLGIKDKSLKQRYLPITLNLREPYQIEKKFNQAMKHLEGHLDCLFMCHGYLKNHSMEEVSLKDWDDMMYLNVRPTLHLLSLASPFLKLSKGSATVLSANAGETPVPGAVVFSTAMSMVNMMVKSAALESAFHGVRVNAVAPGVTETGARSKKEGPGMTDGQNKTYLAEASQDVPLNN